MTGMPSKETMTADTGYRSTAAHAGSMPFAQDEKQIQLDCRAA
jgi:hypothetical protein